MQYAWGASQSLFCSRGKDWQSIVAENLKLDSQYLEQGKGGQPIHAAEERMGIQNLLQSNEWELNTCSCCVKGMHLTLATE
jgi:hypothetical protein